MLLLLSRTCRWCLFQPRALVTSSRETVTLFSMWVQRRWISQEAAYIEAQHKWRHVTYACLVRSVCVQVLKVCLLVCFSRLLPDKSKQGLRPVHWHSLLDWKVLLSGRAGRSSHLRHPAGRVPGRESGAAQGGAGQWVAPIQELLQEWPYVSQRKGLVPKTSWWWLNTRERESHTHSHTHTCAHLCCNLPETWLTTLIPLYEIVMTQITLVQKKAVQKKKQHFPLTLQINLWLPIVFFFFFFLCAHKALRKKNVKINKQETLPATLPFIPTHTGIVVFLLHLNFAHIGYADLSSATKRVEWPRVFTMLTSMPTMSCACCTSKGGSMSQRQRYTQYKEL